MPSGLPLWPPIFYKVGWRRGHLGFVSSPLLLPACPPKREDLAEAAFQSVTVTYFISLTDSLTKFNAVLVSLSLMHNFCQHSRPPVWSTNLVNNSCQQYVLVSNSCHKICLIVCFSGFPLFPIFPLLYCIYLSFLP